MLGIGLAWLLSGVLYLTLPPSPDQFELDYMGWRILEGDAPYRDFIDMNWPGTYWLHALSTALFGHRVWSWKGVDFLLLAMSAAFLADLLRRSAGLLPARLLLVLMPLLYAGLSSWVAGQHDMMSAHFLSGVLWFHCRAQEPGRWRRQLGAGAFLGLAMLCKPTSGALGALLAAQSLWLRVPVLRVAGQTAVAAAASIAVILGGFALQIARGTGVRDIVDCVWTYNVETQYLQYVTHGQVLKALVVSTGWWLALTVAAVPGAVRALRRANRSAGTTGPLMLWAAGLVSYAVQHRGLGYHLSACFGGLVALIALGPAAAGSVPGRRPLRLAGLAVVLAYAVFRLGVNYNSAFQERHDLRYQEAEGLTIADAKALAARMEREIPPNETALVMGSASSMNFLSRRPQSTRFAYPPVLLYAVPPMALADRWCDWFEADLRRSVPRWVLVPGDYQEWLARDVRVARALRALLSTGYRAEGLIGRDPGYRLYVREAP